MPGDIMRGPSSIRISHPFGVGKAPSKNMATTTEDFTPITDFPVKRQNKALATEDGVSVVVTEDGLFYIAMEG